jgi:hypothetical protein
MKKVEMSSSVFSILATLVEVAMSMRSRDLVEQRPLEVVVERP